MSMTEIFVRSPLHAFLTVLVICIIVASVMSSQLGVIKYTDKNKDGTVNIFDGEISVKTSPSASSGQAIAISVLSGVIGLGLIGTVFKQYNIYHEEKKKQMPQQQ